MKITLDISDEVADLLTALSVDPITGGLAFKTQKEAVKAVILQLIDHAQQGVYRPGAWERGWVMQAFGDAFVEQIEPSLRGAMFDQRRKGGGNA
jgi:hypothetical protein